MLLQISAVALEEIAPTAECLLGRVKEVRSYLRRKGFSDHAIEHAVTVLYRAAMPYVRGTKVCKIKNRRAWVFIVAIRAAIRAAKREVQLSTVEPAILAATVIDHGIGDERCDISNALMRLTEKQYSAVELCILGELSLRAAAKEMGIAVGTLCGLLAAAKQRLKKLVPEFLPPS